MSLKRTSLTRTTRLLLSNSLVSKEHFMDLGDKVVDTLKELFRVFGLLFLNVVMLLLLPLSVLLIREIGLSAKKQTMRRAHARFREERRRAPRRYNHEYPRLKSFISENKEYFEQ